MTAEQEAPPAGVSIRELEQRWGISRNGLKARANALGVALQRASSTLTLWPSEYLELGDQLHEHLSSGQAMGTFPGIAAVVAAADTASGVPSVPPPADPLARARALAAAADEALPLEAAELAAVLGWPVELVEQLKGGTTIRGFRLYRSQHKGRGRYWWVERCRPASTARAVINGSGGNDGAGMALPPPRRLVGFGAVAVDAINV